jgi:hypothetical protein
VAVGYSAGYSGCGGVPKCTVQQILVIDPATGRPLAEELRYVKLPGGAHWPPPDRLLSYEIYGTAHWTNAGPPS